MKSRQQSARKEGTASKRSAMAAPHDSKRREGTSSKRSAVAAAQDSKRKSSSKLRLESD